jgi:hypothetical protein
LKPVDIEFGKVLTKVTFLGLVMNVMIPIGIFGAAVFFTGYDMHSGRGLKIPEEDILRLLFFALLIVSAIDFGVTYFIRKKLTEKLFRSDKGKPGRTFEQAVFTLSIIIFSLNLSYSIYGLVLILMGGDLEVMMLFTALSLVAYQLFRPRQKYLERLRDLMTGASPE